MSSVHYTASAQRPGTMNLPTPAPRPIENAEGVSWRAVVAGAVAACALSFILFTLGTGLGLSALSPWRYEGIAPSKLAIPAVLWVVFTQLAASGIGGYMAGRLRGRWTSLRDHEVYFRDTAHGLLAWGLSTLVMAALMGAALTGAVNQATRTAGTAAMFAATALNNDKDGGAYWVDAMLRVDTSQAGQVASSAAPFAVDSATDSATRAQMGRILLRSLQTGALTADDSRYLAQLVSQRTGLPQAEAQTRVNTIYTDAKKALYDAAATIKQQADDGRKATAYTALWMVVALLAGAFVSAWLATFGGRQRDGAADLDL